MRRHTSPDACAGSVIGREADRAVLAVAVADSLLDGLTAMGENEWEA